MPQLLDYFYENKVHENDLKTLLELVNFCFSLLPYRRLDNFYNHCLTTIESKLTPDQVLPVIWTAFTTSNKQLLDVAERYLNRNDLNLCSITKVDILLTSLKQTWNSSVDIAGLYCQHLREQLICTKKPELWYELYLFTSENKENHYAVQHLYEACLKLASQSVGISDKYLENFPEEKLKSMTVKEIKKVLKEAELISCEKLTTRINEYLSADPSDDE